MNDGRGAGFNAHRYCIGFINLIQPAENGALQVFHFEKFKSKNFCPGLFQLNMS